MPVFLGTRNHGFRYDPKLRFNAPQSILFFIIFTTWCSKAFGTLKVLACHGICEIIGITCGGSILFEKWPFSVNSKAIPASQLNSTSRKMSHSSTVKSLPTLSSFMCSLVTCEARSISETLESATPHKHRQAYNTLLKLLLDANCLSH